MHNHYATLREIEEWYSVDDVIDANDVLDFVAEASKPRTPMVPHDGG